MSKTAKKIIICTLVGIMQVGLGASIIEASPSYTQRVIQLDGRDHRGRDNDQHQRDNDQRQRKHDQRQREENERHEREMRRHRGERDRDWHERQDRENRRHTDANNEIGSFLIGFVIGSLIK